MPNVSNIQYNGTTYGIEGVTDATLTISGRAADAAAVGAALARGSGLTEEAKQALLACFAQVAWIGDDGQDYYDALEAALYPPTNLVSISAVYTQSGTVYDTDTLDSLKPDLVVTAHYNDSTTAVVTGYTLSGTLAVGTSTITVRYSGKTTTFSVTVSQHWSYSMSDLTKVTGTCSNNSSANCGIGLNNKTGTDLHRRSFMLDHGETSIALANSSTSVYQQTSDYYPVKVPSGATSFTVSVLPNTQYVQVLCRQLNNGVYSAYTATGPTGYVQSSITKTMESTPNNVYLFVTTKYDSAGTSYPTEPTGLTVTFS